MVLKYNPLLVPPPVSSSDEEPSDSENDVPDSNNDVSDSENDVLDSDSDNDVLDSDNDGSEAESGENDVDSEDDVIEVEDSEDEQPIGLLKKSKAGASSSKVPTAGASSSKAPTAGASSPKAPAAEPGLESDSDGGSDEVRSVSSPDSDGFTVRQIVLKREKHVVAGTCSGKKPARSGPSGSEAEKKRKRKKVDGGDGAERSEKKKEVDSGKGAAKLEKRALFQRLWSEEDEIALLQGLGVYERQKGTDPFYEMDGFFEFIKGSIHITVTQTQLVNKARRMRRKFARNATRGKDGKDPSFRRLHDRRAYEVSKTIWGDEKMKIGPKRRGRPFGTKNRVASRKREVIKKEDAPQNTQEEKGGEVFWARYPCLRDSIDSFPSLPEWGKKLMIEKLIETPEEKLIELEGRWKELSRAVSELHLSHLQLIKDQAKVVHETMTSDRQ